MSHFYISVNNGNNFSSSGEPNHAPKPSAPPKAPPAEPAATSASVTSFFARGSAAINNEVFESDPPVQVSTFEQIENILVNIINCFFNW